VLQIVLHIADYCSNPSELYVHFVAICKYAKYGKDDGQAAAMIRQFFAKKKNRQYLQC
jgi:hypothetical protein